MLAILLYLNFTISKARFRGRISLFTGYPRSIFLFLSRFPENLDNERYFLSSMSYLIEAVIGRTVERVHVSFATKSRAISTVRYRLWNENAEESSLNCISEQFNHNELKFSIV